MPAKRNKNTKPPYQTQTGMKKNGQGVHAPTQSPNQSPNQSPVRRWLVVLASGVLGASLLILAWIWIVPPPKDPQDPASPTDLGLSDSGAEQVNTEQSNTGQSNTGQSSSSLSTPLSSSLKFPTANDRLTTEKLQSELESVAQSLSREFPQDPKAHHVAAMIYAELRQTKRALSSWESCLAISRIEVGPVIGMSKILLDQGEEDRAIALMEGIQQDAKEKLTVDFYLQLSDAYSQIGELEKAERIAEEGLNRFPQDAGLHRVCGLARMQLQKLEQAESSLRQAIALGDRSTSTRNTLRGLLLRLGKTDEAQQFNDAKQASLENSEADNRVPKHDSGDSAFQSLYRDSLQQLALTLLHNACAVAMANRKADLAEQWALLAITESPKSPAPYMDLATALRSQRRLLDAYLVHEKLVEVQPDNAYNDLNLASVAAELGQLQRAEQILMRGATKFPRTAAFPGELAKITLNQGEMDKAQRFALRAAELEPQNVDWVLVLAVIAKNSGRNESFQELLDRANRLSPGDARLRNLTK